MYASATSQWNHVLKTASEKSNSLINYSDVLVFSNHYIFPTRLASLEKITDLSQNWNVPKKFQLNFKAKEKHHTIV